MIRIDSLSGFNPKWLKLSTTGPVLTVTICNPNEAHNTLTIDNEGGADEFAGGSYPELVALFQFFSEDSHQEARQIRVVVLTGEAVTVKGEMRRSFSAGGSPKIIVQKLVAMKAGMRRKFTKMTVDLVRYMVSCPQVVLAAIDGTCAGAGMALACASFMRFGTERAKAACLFNQMGLSGADMGVEFFLPRLIGAGRAARMLSFRLPFAKGETPLVDPWMNAKDGLDWGFYQGLFPPSSLLEEVQKLADLMCQHNAPAALRATKRAFYGEMGGMSVAQALDYEQDAQGSCMVGRPDLGADDMGTSLKAFTEHVEPVWRPFP